MNGTLEERPVDTLPDVSPGVSFEGRYTDKAILDLLAYYADRKNNAKVKLVIAEDGDDLSKVIKQFEEEQIALSKSAGQTKNHLVIVAPFVADSVIRWGFATFYYATPASKPEITYYEPELALVKDILHWAIMERIKPEEGVSPYILHSPKVSEAADSDTVIVELIRTYMLTGELSELSEINIKQARIIHGVDYGIMKSIAMRRDREVEEVVDTTVAEVSETIESPVVATVALMASPRFSFAGELTKERMPELAISAAKAGNTKFLELLLNVKQNPRNAAKPVKQLITNSEYEDFEYDQYQYYKDKWAVQMPIRFAVTRKEFLNRVINGSLVFESPELLLAALDIELAETLAAMPIEFAEHLTHKDIFKDDREFAEKEVAAFTQRAKHKLGDESLSGHFSRVNSKLSLVENAKRWLVKVEAKLRDCDEEMVKLEPQRDELGNFHGQWLVQLGEKAHDYDQLIENYRTKVGVIHNWEDVPVDYVNITKAGKKLICAALLDVNFQDADGNTLLHQAISNRQLNLVHVLLKLGAKTNIVNNLGEARIALAERIGFLPCMAVVDPTSISVTTIQAGVESCNNFIGRFRAKLNVFHIQAEIILNQLIKIGSHEFYLYGYTLRELDMLSLQSGLPEVEAGCGLVGNHIYTELPAFTDRMALFIFNASNQLTSMERAILKLEEGIWGDKGKYRGLMDSLVKVRRDLVKALRGDIFELQGSPAFLKMHRLAMDIKEGSQYGEAFNIVRFKEQAVIDLAIANERTLAIMRERDSLVTSFESKLAEERAKSVSALALASSLKEEVLLLREEAVCLKAKNVELEVQVGDYPSEGGAKDAMLFTQFLPSPSVGRIFATTACET